jgi:CheY-like chemotaxis protein
MQEPHVTRNPDARCVLVVEDSQVQSKIICKQIQALTDFPTLAAHSMEEVAATLERHGPDIFIAVADLNLPDAPDGEAVDLLLEHGVTSMVLTATFNEQIRTSFIERRVADFFFKGTIRDMDPMVLSLERIYKNRSVQVLVVDDSRTERSYMRHLLEIQHFQVLEAEHGAEALEVLDAHPDVTMVITDYNMPVMDGFELIRTLRERHKKDKLAIIGVSAAGSGSLSARLLKNGANDFLTKPFEVEEFYWRANQNIEMLEIIQELTACYGDEDA